MKHVVWSLLTLAVLAMCSNAQAGFVTVGAFATFTETQGADRTGDLFTITNTSELDSGIGITGISIQLPSDLVFDTAGGRVANPSSDFQALMIPIGGTYSSQTAFGSSFDGSQRLALHFTGFNPGQTFSFAIDVDKIVGNGNVERLHVNGRDFASASFDVTFDSPVIPTGPQTFSGSFAAAMALPPMQPRSAYSFVSGLVDPPDPASDPPPLANPEPSSLLLLGVGILGMFVLIRKRSLSAARL